MNSLDDAVRDALTEDAQRAPQPRDWNGPSPVVVIHGLSTVRPGRARMMFAAIGLVAAATVALIVVHVRTNTTVPTKPLFRPAGTEFVIRDLGPATESPPFAAPAVSSLTRVIGIDGQPDLTVSTVLTYEGNDTAYLWRCTSSTAGAACSPEWNHAAHDVSLSSSIDNHLATYDEWIWANVPPTAAYVTYASGTATWWQRPIFGTSVFPLHDHAPNQEHATVTAYTSDGTEITHFDSADPATFDPTNPTRLPPQANLSTAQASALSESTVNLMRTCLTDNGGNFHSGDVAEFTSPTQETEAWTKCVASTKQTISEQVNLDIRTYDPAVDGPQNPTLLGAPAAASQEHP